MAVIPRDPRSASIGHWLNKHPVQSSFTTDKSIEFNSLKLTASRDAGSGLLDARVFAGFNFRFSCNDASSMGAQVANYAESTLMQRTDGESEQSDVKDS